MPSARAPNWPRCGLPPTGPSTTFNTVYQGFLRVRDCPLPTIAAVNGPAVGAGFNLALACDVRMVGPDALFDARFTALRLHPGGGHAWMLARAVGPQQAMLACLFGEVWDARAAVATGLAAALVEEDLIDDAVALGQRLAKQEKAYVQRLTATLRGALSTPEHADALAEETAAQRWSAWPSRVPRGRPGHRGPHRPPQLTVPLTGPPLRQLTAPHPELTRAAPRTACAARPSR